MEFHRYKQIGIFLDMFPAKLSWRKDNWRILKWLHMDIPSVNHCGGEENRQQSRDMQSTILHQNSNIVCGIVGSTKSVNNAAYKSFIVKSISVKKPSSVPYSNRMLTIFAVNCFPLTLVAEFIE